ncbi:cyclase family protein [Tepidibacillus infernus]|uniref:Kynurenine formamidase n=1 Tax=Tepidibacillus decaturensis TaxID=1413211 RepID=A0A135L2S0_9BACI|nr:MULTISPECIES: cyclase family protein [Tepidibacillus]KXG43262.1 cyclase [Tepidibacillus decaturensis]GBF11009.1 kynurenine formamidase [Tepidibacillus sp. HK-1]
MEIYDISMMIHQEMPVYKNKEEKRPVLKTMQDFATGHVFESRIQMDMHTGTHVDAPLHMIENGNTIDTLDLRKVVTPCKVIDLTAIKEKITKEDLQSINLQKNDFVLFKTKNSYDDQFNQEFVYLDRSGAQYLTTKGIKGVGIDALGIERSQPGHETHISLMEAGIVILEGLRLKDIDEGEYFLYAAPLFIKGAEAAPTRAILVKMNYENVKV